MSGPEPYPQAPFPFPSQADLVKLPPAFGAYLDLGAQAAMARSRANGFGPDDEMPSGVIKLQDEVRRLRRELSFARALLLIHSEVSEIVEADRKDPDAASSKIDGFKAIEEELADVQIRVLDFAAARGLRLGPAVEAKHEFNGTRPRKHGKRY